MKGRTRHYSAAALIPTLARLYVGVLDGHPHHPITLGEAPSIRNEKPTHARSSLASLPPARLLASPLDAAPVFTWPPLSPQRPSCGSGGDSGFGFVGFVVASPPSAHVRSP